MKARWRWSLTLMLVASCTTAWHPLAAGDVTDGRLYDALLVVTRDGYELELKDATIRPDSITGQRTDSLRGQRFAIARTNVARVESRESDPAPLFAAIGGFVADVGRGIGQLVGTLARCIVLKC